MLLIRVKKKCISSHFDAKSRENAISQIAAHSLFWIFDTNDKPYKTYWTAVLLTEGLFMILHGQSFVQTCTSTPHLALLLKCTCQIISLVSYVIFAFCTIWLWIQKVKTMNLQVIGVSNLSNQFVKAHLTDR